MYTIHVESSLAHPLSGSAVLEISPRDTVRKVVNDFLFSIEKENGIPGLVVYDKEYNKLDWDSAIEDQGLKQGTTLYISYEKTPFFQPIHFAVIGIAVIIIAVVLLLVVCVLFASTGGDVPFDYGIVIDAGSTHSQVFLYQWSGSKYLGTGEVFQRDSCEIEEGIAEELDPDSLVSCVNNVTKAVPGDNISPVILYLGATAGMRLLNLSNPLDAHLILMTIKYALQTSPVQENSIEIIQGEDEGLFSWVTTNFLSKTLNQNEVTATYGALDLGGASTQIAYAVDSEHVKDLTNIKVLKLYGHEYFVVSKSFLCFGLTQALHRTGAIILMEDGNKTIYNPCLPKNYSLKVEVKKYFATPCANNRNLTTWFEKNPLIKQIEIIGNGNYEECTRVVTKLVNPDVCSDMGFSNCLEILNITVQNRKFMAFSSFYYIVHYLAPNGSFFKFINETKNFCNLSYEEIKEKSPDPNMLAHLLQFCFGAVYISELLMSYGFTPSTWDNIIFQKDINGAEVGWSLGFMINATNAIPEEMPRLPVIALGAFIPLILISVFMILFAVMLLNRKFKLCHKGERETLLESVE